MDISVSWELEREEENVFFFRLLGLPGGIVSKRQVHVVMTYFKTAASPLVSVNSKFLRLGNVWRKSKARRFLSLMSFD